ncbi:hypothetical protein [Rhodococcus sp. BS-15]|nr:hypothetical protein [Rhodococcus sp. BS-15]
MTDTERERIIEAGKKAAVGAPPIPDAAARLIREAFRVRPTRVTR